MAGSNAPNLGSAFLRAQTAPTTPESVADLSPLLCSNLSAFKSLIANYRRLDDTITMRMNRAHALAQRDPKRPYAELSEPECATFFRELVSVWKGREQALSYCTQVARGNMARKQVELLGADPTEDSKLDLDRSARDILYSEQVKVDQMQRESEVERIVRRRTLAVFLARCRSHPSSFALESGREEEEVRLDLLKQ